MPRVSDVALLRAFVAAAAAWPVVLLVATYVAAGAHGSLVGTAAAAVYAAAGFVCHQRPERSFHPWGAQLPVCARCAGIYAGGAAMAVMAAAARLQPIVSALRSRWVLLVASAPTAATLAYEWTSHQMPGNWVRAAAGAIIGGAVGWVIYAALARPWPDDGVN